MAGLAVLATSHGQQVAFPGAQGFGKYATGGRGGTVYHVTTLADSGPGSFRDAVSQPNRTIVFDVGGYIVLNSAVSCADNLTIAGQTAPGGGIGIMGNEVSFYNDHNIICRFVRFRQGGSSTGSSAINLGASSSASPSTNMIFDHISVEFGQWDSIDAVNTADFTVQNSIIADPINQQFGAHVEGYNAAWIGDLWANAHNRQPLAKADTIYINNVVYNYQAAYTTGDTGATHNHDIINNYFICGPSTSSPQDDFFQINGTPQNLYFTGNLLDSDKNGSLGGSTTTPSPDNNGRTGNVLTSPWSALTPGIPTYSTVAAYRVALSSAGAFPRDALDDQVVGQVMSLGTSGAIISSPSSTGLANNGYGTIDGGTPLVDSDGDGMPDVWENATGSNPLAPDGNTVAADGYTLLEHYLNWLAAPHAFVGTNTTVIDLWPYTTGFTNGATYSLFNFTNCTVTLTNGHFARFVPTPGFTGLAGFDFAVADPDGTAMTNTMGLLVSIVYIPKNLTWHGDGVSNTWDTTNTADWFDGNELVAFNTGDNVTFDDTGSASPAINVSGAVAPGSVVFDSSQNYTLGGSGAIAGPTSLTQLGPGTLFVTNANSFTGPVRINNSTLQLNNGGTLGSGALVFQSGSLVNNWSTNTTLSLANPIVVTNGTSGTIDLGNRISLSGNISGSGTLNLDLQTGVARDDYKGDASAFTGTVNLTGSGTLRGIINGGAFTGFDSALTTMNAPVTIGFHDNSYGNTFNFGGLSGNNSSVALFTEYAGVPTVSVGALNLDTTFAGQFQTSVSVVKVGTGTLTLTGNSTHTGTTTVSDGTLRVNGSFSSSPVTVASGATLGGNGTLLGGVSVQSGGNLAPDGTLTVGNGLSLASPTLHFGLSSSPGGANDMVSMLGGTLAMSGVQNYVFHLTDNALGAGTYDLIEGATNSTAWSGTTMNLPGTTRQTFSLVRPAAGSNPSYVRLVVTGTAAALVWRGTNGVNWDTSTVNWANGSTPDVFYNLDTVTFDDTGANPGSVTLNGTLTPAAINVNSSQNYAFSGSGDLAGFGPLTKSGSGTLTIYTTNAAYTGNIIVSDGTFAAGSGSSFGGGTITINNGATFALDYSSSLVFVGRDIVVPANQTATVSSDALGNGLSGNLYSSNSASVLNLSGGVSFSGTTSAQFDNFTGTINIQPGATLRFSSNSSGNTYGSTAPAFVINGTLQPRNAGNTVVLGTLSGSGTLAGPQSGSGSGNTLYLIGGDDSDSTFNGVISSNSAVAGSQVLVNKVGNGMLTLTGDGTYTGGTTVSSGTLRVLNTTGSATGSGALEVAAGATLTGAGVVGGATTIDGDATLAPGNPVGSLAFASNLNFSDDSLLNFTLGASSDLVTVGGNLTLTGQLTITNGPGFGPGSYVLFAYGGALDFGNLTLVSAPPGYSYHFDTRTAGVVKLVVARPQFGSVTISPAGLVMNGSNGPANGNYYLLRATNLAEPLTNWTRLMTNQFDDSGDFNFTNAIGTNRQGFYLLQSQ